MRAFPNAAGRRADREYLYECPAGAASLAVDGASFDPPPWHFGLKLPQL